MAAIPFCFWVKTCREFTKNPDPRRFTLSQCCFMWLFVACVATEYEKNFPLINEDDFLTLTDFLDTNYALLNQEMQEAISHDLLIWRTPWGVDWGVGKAAVIDRMVSQYVRIIDG